MTSGLRRVAKDMGKVQINENYTIFSLTKEGFMGLGPMGTEREDRVVLLLGCDVPVVLRWEGRLWRLLGQCYVVGAMHGELLPGLRRRVQDDFEIC